ncbi:MAG: hypothetical protein KatS3mg009_3293 [Acidimicrobiia bacterium]|nr:MAG: hypothetical protein KatS3mg009_3293 [Acidimicrobiia bacterium]
MRVSPAGVTATRGRRPDPPGRSSPRPTPSHACRTVPRRGGPAVADSPQPARPACQPGERKPPMSRRRHLVRLFAVAVVASVVLAACGGRRRGGLERHHERRRGRRRGCDHVRRGRAAGGRAHRGGRQLRRARPRGRGELRGGHRHRVGSGFIIDAEGTVVTNNHVVAGAASAEGVRRRGTDEPVSAKVLGVSECNDLAVIDLEGDGYPFLRWAEGEPKVNREVRALGFPLGDPEFTVTSGIVAEGRGRRRHAVGVGPSAVIEHDAAIQPGNSGGPLVDAQDASVVAVNYAGGDPGTGQSQFFAISAADARDVVETAARGRGRALDRRQRPGDLRRADRRGRHLGRRRRVGRAGRGGRHRARRHRREGRGPAASGPTAR